MKLRKLGEMLIDARVLTGEQLRQALTYHKKSGLKLGKYLIQQGYLTEHQLIEILSRQLKIEKYHPHKHPVEISLAQIIPPGMAGKFQVVPLKKKGNLLTIVMVDPLDTNALDAIEKHTNLEVEPVVCTERDLSQLIRQVYGNSAGWTAPGYGAATAQDTTYAINYICETCGEKTLYPRYAQKQLDSFQDEDPTFVYLYNEYELCRHIVKHMSDMNLELDEIEFCRKCSPGIEKPQMYLKVKWGNNYKITPGITSADLYLLAEFAAGKMKTLDALSHEETLKEHIPRLEELLGARLSENQLNG